MSSKITEKDKELLITNKPFAYDAVENIYFGGYFGNDANDYIEVLIHDTNDNLLETSVVDSEDYSYDNIKGGIKLKTGTILRKLGYDRGRFKVIYNFLRKVAGSYETVVTDQDGNIFNGEVDVNQLDKTLFLKENKYLVHQISPSRTELRLVTQNIRDESYVRDFYNLGARNKKVKSDGTNGSQIEFVVTSEDKSTSTQLRFIPVQGFNEGVFEQSMIGGTISIPNFFLTDRIFPQPVPTAADVGVGSTEVINEDIFQASFFLDTEAGTKVFKNNTRGVEGDTNFPAAYLRFVGLSDDDELEGQSFTDPITGRTFNYDDDGIDFEGDGRTLKDIRNLADSIFDCVYLKRNDPTPEIDIVSNSFIRADTTVEYKWTVTGFDKDGGNFKRIQPRPDGADEGGDFRIVNLGDGYATRDVGSPFKATQTIQGGNATSDTNREGARLRLQLFSKDCHYGIKLEINDNTANDSSTLHLPAIIETH